jgi:hypothetical protein
MDLYRVAVVRTPKLAVMEMDADTNTYPSEPHNISEAKLWYGFIAAPVAWSIQEILGVSLSAQSCPANLPGWAGMGAGLRIVLGIIFLILLTISLSSGFLSVRNWRQIAGDHQILHVEGVTREVFMSMGGVLLSSVFTVAVFWAGIPLVMLAQCQRAI